MSKPQSKTYILYTLSPALEKVTHAVLTVTAARIQRHEQRDARTLEEILGWSEDGLPVWRIEIAARMLMREI